MLGNVLRQLCINELVWKDLRFRLGANEQNADGRRHADDRRQPNDSRYPGDPGQACLHSRERCGNGSKPPTCTRGNDAEREDGDCNGGGVPEAELRPQ